MPENRARMEAAQAKVRALLGREYDLLLGGERVRTDEKLHVRKSRAAR